MAECHGLPVEHGRNVYYLPIQMQQYGTKLLPYPENGLISSKFVAHSA